MANKLVLELLADANPLLKSMEQSQRQINAFTKSANDAGGSLSSGLNAAMNVFTGLANGGAAAAGVFTGGILAAAGAATLLVKNAGEQAEALEHVSQKTGIATGTLQSWTVAMAENGFGFDALTASMKGLSKVMTDARDPASAAANTFEQLGVISSSTDKTIMQIADSFQRMPNGADKARLAVELFGKAGLEMIPILNRGSEGFRESIAQVSRLGVALSDVSLTTLSTADDAFDRLGVATQGLSNHMAVQLAPSVTSVVNAMSNGIGVVNHFFQSIEDGQKRASGDSTFWDKALLVFRAWGTTSLSAIIGAAKQTQEHMAAAEQSMGEMGDVADAHVQEWARSGEIQERLGKQLLGIHIELYKLDLARQHAQEALGRTVNAIAERERKERNADFAMRLQQEEELNNQRFKPAVVSDAMAKHQAAVENLIRLMPELNHQEAALQVLMNQQVAHDAIVSATDAYRDRNKELELGVEYARADFQLQQSWYQQAPGLIDATNNVRTQGFQLIEAEGALRRQVIDQTIFDEERKAAALLALDIDTMTKRKQIISQYPTFWEQQLQAIVASNAFSLSSITSSFNNATAQWIQGKGTFDDFILQSQTTLLTSALQFTEQWLVQLALGQLREMGLLTAQEAAKLGLKTATATAEVALAVSTESQKTLAAQTGASARAAIATEEAVAEQTIMAQTGSAVTSMWESVGESTIAVGKTALEVLGQITDGVMGIIDAIASALEFTGILAPVGIALKGITSMLSGKASGISDALGGFLDGVDFGWVDNIKEFFGFSNMVDLDSIPSVAFASGGIATGPTLGWMAEAGDMEAAIPLNDRGAKFMQRAMGFGGGGGVIIIRNELNGRVLSEEVMKNMPAVYRMKMGNR